MFCHYFILLLCVVAYCNQDGEWFNCKPKPGCSIARCDPRPAGQWFGNDGLYSEYPIICQQNEASSSVTADTEIANQLNEMRIEFAKLDRRLEKSEKVEFEMNFDITLLEKKNAEMRNEMDRVKKEAEEGKRQLSDAMKQITSLEKTNSEMRKEMDSMKKEAEKDKGKLNGAMKQIISLEKTNSKMRNEMDSVKKEAEADKGKLNGAMKTTKELRDRIEILEKKVTELNSISPSEDQSDEDPEETQCEDGIIYRQKCYFAFVHPRQDVTLTNAQDICERNHGKLADILDREHQRLITNYVHPKIPSSGSRVFMWLGMRYQISTKTLQWSNRTSVGDSLNWHSGYGYPRSHSSYTSVGIIVSKVTTATSNGLFNYYPTEPAQGAVCEK